MSEFGEPWSIFPYRNKWSVWRDGNLRENVIGSIHDMSDAERVTAAVNFCRNLPTEWLQKHTAISDHPHEDMCYGPWGYKPLYVDGIRHIPMLVQENAE